MKAGDWIKDALLTLGVQAASQPVKPNDFQAGVRYANRLMSAYDNLGLGFSTIAEANDDINIPPYAEEWAVIALAVRLSPQYGPNDGLMELKMNERNAYLQMLQHLPTDISQEYSNIVPVGSGNTTCGRKFFPGNPDVLLNEQGDYILLEE